MDIRQLRYFLEIAKERQITRAAKKLNMEQPPLSRQLKLMEQELGVVLFDRSGKELELTQAGLVLRREAEEIIRRLNEAVVEIKELDTGISGMLSIGSAVTCSSLVSQQMMNFSSAYPNITYKVLEGDHTALANYLHQRSVELAITRLPFESKEDANQYAVRSLISDPLVAVVHESLCVASISVTLEEIAGLPLLVLKSDRTIGLYDKIMMEYRMRGLVPNVRCECSSVAITISLIMAGMGVAVMPASVVSSFPFQGLVILPIRDMELHSDVGVVWLKDRYLSKSAEVFIRLLLE
ncbi:LysR family transcriptional regulator [Paenibacillus eucommiae]|uniref:DNA-binding transcriptional LysR family regulator n=1 Tax=Paenibacillus eucommiae TaxID=1355755 RepID=A0ABS4INU6_9BACL|nr:LysR family transcriptional regulator [Paenibacillus eucommiae]MBP1989188.1 DNA-binding transcriptional LysR family regulator [Paenibacillus eucommiae]